MELENITIWVRVEVILKDIEMVNAIKVLNVQLGSFLPFVPIRRTFLLL